MTYNNTARKVFEHTFGDIVRKSEASGVYTTYGMTALKSSDWASKDEAAKWKSLVLTLCELVRKVNGADTAEARAEAAAAVRSHLTAAVNFVNMATFNRELTVTEAQNRDTEAVIFRCVGVVTDKDGRTGRDIVISSARAAKALQELVWNFAQGQHMKRPNAYNAATATAITKAKEAEAKAAAIAEEKRKAEAAAAEAAAALAAKAEAEAAEAATKAEEAKAKAEAAAKKSGKKSSKKTEAA